MKLLIVVASFFLFSTQLIACPDCLDNSWHLERPFDNKEYHRVECNCPCRKLNIARGECLDCGHFHFFPPQIIIKRQRPQNALTGWRKIPAHICH
jgi:hypothetical protein